MNKSIQKITTLAMFSAIAYVVMAVGRVPLILFLKYDPKDIVITIAGFIFGPVSALIVSLIVSFVEMITVSSDGIIGFFMNVIATFAFAGTASIIYNKKRNNVGAVIGVAAGCIVMTIVMLLWNYFLAPIFMGYPRETVVELLIPAFLPFNLIKGGINAALVLILHKPILAVLHKLNLIPTTSTLEAEQKRNNWIIFFAALVIVSCIMLVLALNDII